jgi:sugar lactone lactonase YvrE
VKRTRRVAREGAPFVNTLVRGLGAVVLAAALLAVSASGAAAGTVTDTFTGTVDVNGTSALVFTINVGDLSVPIQANLDWTNASANLNLYLIAPGSTTPVAQATGPAKPKTLDYTPLVTGQYKLRVKANSGASDFTLGVTYGNAGGGGIAAYQKTFGYKDTSSMYPYGMAYDPSDNTVLVGDYWNFKVRRFSASGNLIATYKNAAATGVGAPYDVATDPFDTPPSGLRNYWVADQEQGDVVEFDHNGNVLHQLGPDGTGSYLHPKGCGGGAMTFPTYLTVDPSNGDLYIADVRCKNVWVFAHDGTFLRQFDWTGWKAATGLTTPTPRGIQMDENGNVYVLELNSHRISVFNKAGQFQSIFPDVPSDLDLRDPRGMDIDTTHHVIYAVGAQKQVVLKYDYQGNLLKEWDSPTGSFHVPTDPKFNSIRVPAVDPTTGNVYVGDSWGYRVYKSDANGAPIWASKPMPPSNGGYTQDTGVAVSPSGKLFVGDSFGQRIQAFDTASSCPSFGTCPAFLFTFGTRVNSSPNATCCDYPKQLLFADGYLWIAETDGNDIFAYHEDGTWVHRFGQQGPGVGQFRGGVGGLSVANGLVFATDVGNCRLQVWTEAAMLANTWILPQQSMSSCGSATNQMTAPHGVVTDGGSTAYVMENGAGGRVAIWNWATQQETGTVRPVCGGTALRQPGGATWDATHTWIYIADTGNKRIVRWNPVSLECDVVSTGSDTPEGAFGGPDFLNFGPDGTLYVSDNNQHVYAFAITG